MAAGGLNPLSPAALRAPSTTQPQNPALKGQEEVVLVNLMSEEVDILGLDSEGEDLPLGQMGVGVQQVEEEQEQSTLFYQQV